MSQARRMTSRQAGILITLAEIGRDTKTQGQTFKADELNEADEAIGVLREVALAIRKAEEERRVETMRTLITNVANNISWVPIDHPNGSRLLYSFFGFNRGGDLDGMQRAHDEFCQLVDTIKEQRRGV